MEKFYMSKGLKMYFESGMAKALSEENNQGIIRILKQAPDGRTTARQPYHSEGAQTF
jgi:hypothetical protein